MNPAPDKTGGWTRTRWLLTVLGVMGLQVGLIFALGERTLPRPRPAGATQTLRLSAARTELQELLDPTLFARPHARDFSADSWLRAATPVFPVFRWTEPTRPLELAADRLGNALGLFLRTNIFASFSLDGRPAPDMLAQPPDDIVEAVPARSELAVTGDLAARALLNPPALPAWPAEDILTNTVIQALVDESGRVHTAVLLGAERVNGGSGSLEADRLALTLTRDLRFAPRGDGGWLSSPVAQLTPGVLVFQWRTVPTTNGAAAPVQPP